MDELESNEEINYNNPVTVTEIFRVAAVEAIEPQSNHTQIEGFDDVINERERPPLQAQQVIKEYAFKTSFGWEDVRYIGEHPYPDDWKQFAGPKYALQLAGKNSEILILGSYIDMLRRWTTFRNKFPMFREEEP